MEGYRLLPPVFRPEAVAPRSTCIQRAMLTLQGVLAGMYPDLKVWGPAESVGRGVGQGVEAVTGNIAVLVLPVQFGSVGGDVLAS